MELTLTRSNAPRKSNLVVFNIAGRRGSVQFRRSLFGEAVPATPRTASSVAGK